MTQDSVTADRPSAAAMDAYREAVSRHQRTVADLAAATDALLAAGGTEPAVREAVSGRTAGSDGVLVGRAAPAPGERAGRYLLDHLGSERESVVAALAGPATTVIDDVRDLLADADIAAGARRAILDLDMLTSAAVADALGAQGKNRRETASRLRASGTLIGVPNPVARGYLYPRFQLDLARRRVHPVVAEVNRATGAAADPWGVASWWVSPHGPLGELAPMDLIGGDREHDLLVMNDLAPAESASDAQSNLAAHAALVAVLTAADR